MDPDKNTGVAIPDGPLTPGSGPDVLPPKPQDLPAETDPEYVLRVDSAEGEQALTGQVSPTATSPERTVYPILFAISFSHLLNDTMQSVIPSIYPIVRRSFSLSYTQVGLITFVFQLSAALLQPFVGLYTDKRPQPYSLAIGMGFTLVGLLVLSRAPSYGVLLLAVALVGMGSSVFHPEASRIAYLASGGRRGLAQSLFQVGGNAGSSVGPLLAALIIVPFGIQSIGWFSIIALVAMGVLWMVGRWYSGHIVHLKTKPTAHATPGPQLSRGKVVASISILLALIFSKYFYFVSLTSYLTFYMIHKFGVSVQASQGYLFAFLFAVAVGTFVGGPLGDKYGRKYVIWASILGVAPFTLALPYANLAWTTVLIVIIGLVMASAFSAILVYAQELVPGKVGLVSGLFFGFAFGMAGVGSAVLGALADVTSIDLVYRVCSFLPLIGLVTGFLPNLHGTSRRQTAK